MFPEKYLGFPKPNSVILFLIYLSAFAVLVLNLSEIRLGSNCKCSLNVRDDLDSCGSRANHGEIDRRAARLICTARARPRREDIRQQTCRDCCDAIAAGTSTPQMACPAGVFAPPRY
jgi:hypothetical protein